MIIMLCGVSIFIALSLAGPSAMDVFRFGPLHADDLGLTLAIGVGALVLLELSKRFWREVPAPAAH